MLDKHFHRRNLPHLYYNEGIYFVTFRLYGSLHPEELKGLHILQKNQTLHPADQKKTNYMLNYRSLMIDYNTHIHKCLYKLEQDFELCLLLLEQLMVCRVR